MPTTRPLTPVQIETLEAAIEGRLIAERKEFGTQKYLGFLLPDGREVTRRVIALRKRGFLKWQGAGRIVPTPEGVEQWRVLSARGGREPRQQGPGKARYGSRTCS